MMAQLLKGYERKGQLQSIKSLHSSIMHFCRQNTILPYLSVFRLLVHEKVGILNDM